MTRDVLEISDAIVDGTRPGELSEIHRIDAQVHTLTPAITLVESFAHVVSIATDDGLVLFDTSYGLLGEAVRAALRTHTDAPVRTMIYTHSHRDHIGGSIVFMREAESRGDPRPAVVAHARTAEHMSSFDRMRGYDAVVNRRQFQSERYDPGDGIVPTDTFWTTKRLLVGGTEIHLTHARGETDDHLWGWLPETRAVMAGDFLIWAFPNAGNPQKEQRYPLEWAEALRAMLELEPELVVPAHGLPVRGIERIRTVLGDSARALESIADQTLEQMNAGERLDTILHSVHVPDDLVDRPWLQPVYDDPEFIVHNVWRQYGGWWDGNPARLRPAPDASVAAELAALAGGAAALAARAATVADAGDLRLAAHLVETAALAEPDNAGVHEVRRSVYSRLRDEARSQMARGIYGWASDESAKQLGTEDGS